MIGIFLLSITYLIGSLILASQYLAILNYIALGLITTVIVPLAFIKIESHVK